MIVTGASGSGAGCEGPALVADGGGVGPVGVDDEAAVDSQTPGGAFGSGFASSILTSRSARGVMGETDGSESLETFSGLRAGRNT